MPPTRTTRDECRIIYYLDDEPDSQLESPVAGQPYHIKVLVPLNQLRHYARTQDWHGQPMAFLRDHRSYIQCDIQVHCVDYPRGRPVDKWMPFAGIRAEWNGAPAHDGYVTFASLNPVGGIYHGGRYSHCLRFFEGLDGTAPHHQLTFYTNSFQISY
ncbi:hypothetical protein F5X97DRAFT_324636 [Nemania serpens]|nr:hypothetical protein F5X97DRAFT_324636 [Nemania serpens]